MEKVEPNPLQNNQPLEKVEPNPLQNNQPLEKVEPSPLQNNQPLEKVEPSPLQNNQPLEKVEINQIYKISYYFICLAVNTRKMPKRANEVWMVKYLIYLADLQENNVPM